MSDEVPESLFNAGVPVMGKDDTMYFIISKKLVYNSMYLYNIAILSLDGSAPKHVVVDEIELCEIIDRVSRGLINKNYFK